MNINTNFIEVSLRENRFWLRIMAEHALFIRLGLPCDETELINEARKLERLFRNLLKRAKNTPKKEDAVRKLNKDVIKALDRIIDFKSRVLERIITCNLGGSNLPLLVDHIRREAIRFRVILLRLQNDIEILPAEEALQEEIFWLRIMGEHAHFVAHLLDPSERKLVKNSRDFSKHFEELRLQASDLESMEAPRTFECWLLPSDKCGKNLSSVFGKELPKAFVIPRLERFNREAIQLTEDIKEFKKTLLQLIESCTVLSIIPPLLADHILREARKALEDLANVENMLLKKNKDKENSNC